MLYPDSPIKSVILRVFLSPVEYLTSWRRHSEHYFKGGYVPGFVVRRTTEWTCHSLRIRRVEYQGSRGPEGRARAQNWFWSTRCAVQTQPWPCKALGMQMSGSIFWHGGSAGHGNLAALLVHPSAMWGHFPARMWLEWKVIKIQIQYHSLFFWIYQIIS